MSWLGGSSPSASALKIHCCRVELLQIVMGIATEKFRRFESYPRNNIFKLNLRGSQVGKGGNYYFLLYSNVT